MRSHFFIWVFLFLFLAAPVWAAKELPVQDLIAVAGDGSRHVIHAEIADTDETRSNGLMFRTDMPEDHGMLFVFAQSQPLGFWMRNTFLPLDMLFITDDGTIHHIHRNAVPLDETAIMSQGAVSRVLELNGGTADRLGLKEGDRIYNEAYFGNKLAE